MRKLIIISLLSLVWPGILLAQNTDDINLERQLSRLKTSLEQVASIIRLFPDIGSNDVTPLIKQKFEEANEAYLQAEEFARNGMRRKARLAIAQGFVLLKQIEAIIKQHPFLRTNFQEQLDRRILQAEQLVNNNGDRQLISMLERAINLRQDAYRLFQQGRIRAAFEHYHSALVYATQIIQIASNQSDVRGDDELRKFYLDTQLLSERAATLIQGSPSAGQQWNNLHSRAEAELEDVKRLYEKKNYAAAYQKLVTINRLLYRIIDSIEKTPQTDGQRIIADLESLERSLLVVQEKLAENPQPAAESIYRSINNLARKTHRLINQNKLILARRNLSRANQLLLKLNNLMGGASGQQPQRINRKLASTKIELDKIKQNTASGMEAETLISLIEENYYNAEQAFQNGEFLKASFYLKIANRMILRYNRLQLNDTSQKVKQKGVERELQRLATLMSQIENEKVDEERQIRYKNAQSLQQMAEDAYDRGEYAISKEYTKLAINLITK